MQGFYHDVIAGLVARGVMKRDMSVLVLCGGTEDKDVFKACGFSNVTISNVDSRMQAGLYAPYAWSFQDAENLSLESDTFDFVVVHSGLHHCHSPHRGLLEAYRVARRAVVIFEPYDSFVTRLGAALGFGQVHEHAAVHFDDAGFGGLRNTQIPNYVYRFTRREIEKTVQSYEPLGWHRIAFIHALRIPWTQLLGRRNKLYVLAVATSYPLLALASRVFPWACNNFAAVIEKLDPDDKLHPWLRATDSGVALDERWLERRYGKRPAIYRAGGEPERTAEQTRQPQAATQLVSTSQEEVLEVEPANARRERGAVQ